MSKISSLTNWYRRWRACNYRDTYRFIYGDERILNDGGLVRELQLARQYVDLWRSKHDELHLRLEKIQELHARDDRFPTDCFSACKEGYPCNHLNIALGPIDERKKKMPR